MVRGKGEWTQAKFERYIKEGRGKGSGKDYKPWITIQDFSSKGRSSRIPGWKSNRVHHFFSDSEKQLFYVFEWSDVVKDIKEHFPLDDLDLAINIANEMGIKYPTDSQSGTSCVLTTDFMLTVFKHGKLISIARTFKRSSELERKQVNVNLELEKRYYLAKGIDWGIITEKEIPKQLAENVEWIHSAYQLEATPEIAVSELKELASILKCKLQETKNTINTVTKALDKDMNIKSGTSLYILRYLIARKEVIIDMLNTKVSACPSTEFIQNIIF
jgi:hypothetical protein